MANATKPQWRGSQWRGSQGRRASEDAAPFDPRDFQLEGCRYRALEQRGAGAYGRVFKAVRTSAIGREALVMLKASRVESAELRRESVAVQRRRLETEGRILAELGVDGRPEFCTLLAHGWHSTEQTTYLLIFRRDEGAQSVREALAHGGLPLRDVAALAYQAACGLSFLHEELGVFHRDLKPANILRVGHGGSLQHKLIDFGAAQPTGASAVPGTATAVPGQYPRSARYVPADARGASGSAATDFFALGVTLWEALFGEPPADEAVRQLPSLWPMEGAYLARRPESAQTLSPLLAFIGALRADLPACRPTGFEACAQAARICAALGFADLVTQPTHLAAHLGTPQIQTDLGTEVAPEEVAPEAVAVEPEVVAAIRPVRPGTSALAWGFGAAGLAVGFLVVGWLLRL